MIPYGRQDIDQSDIDAVVAVLQSDFLTQGPQVPVFERMVAEYVGAKHGVGANSATSALHIACKALELGPGDWLWTSPVTFVASANCALYCGAQVDFVDIDPRTNNLCSKALEQKLKVAHQEGRLPKVVVPVHLCGNPCDMAAIHALSLRYDFKIIEDASHAIGGRYQGKSIGNGDFSDITVFSFHPVKIITTAEGGMALTNSDQLAHRMALLRNHGITRDPAYMTREPDGPWYYQQIELGFNYRMTELQAALGISQIKRIDSFISRRHEIANRYKYALKSLPLELPPENESAYSAYHLYVIKVRQPNKENHRELYEFLVENGIGVNIHYIPIHLQPYYSFMGFEEGDFKHAEQYYTKAISLPMYPNLTLKQQEKVIATITRFFER